MLLDEAFQSESTDWSPRGCLLLLVAHCLQGKAHLKNALHGNPSQWWQLEALPPLPLHEKVMHLHSANTALAKADAEVPV